MPRNVPILFNRSVEVPAGEEKCEPLTLSNTFREIELFELGTIDERYEGDWKAAPVTARVEVGTHAEKSFQLRHHLPADSPPGLHPFALIAHLQYRNLWLRLPGLMRVPAFGGWEVEVQASRAAQTVRNEEGEEHLELRPWQREVEVQLVLTNRSSDWLYLDIQLENTNNAWDYQLARRRACLPPWSAAHTAQPAAKTSFASALNLGLTAPAAARSQAVVPDAPVVKIPLQIRPKKRKWFGTPAGGNGETNPTVRVAPLNPETGLPEKAELRPMRVVYVPARSPLDLLQPVIQKGGAFFRFLFSKRGLFTVGGIAAAIYMLLRGGPLTVYYDARDFCMRTSISDIAPVNNRTTYRVDEDIQLNYEITNAEVRQIAYAGKAEAIQARGPKVIPAGSLRIGSNPITITAYRTRWYGRTPDRSQAPYANATRTIDITVTGRKTTAPKLFGLRLADAQTAAQRQGGFKLVIEGGDTAPAATIKSQKPGAGEKALEGSEITVTLALPEIPPPPDFQGQPLSAVKAWAEKNHAPLQVTEVPVPGLPAGTIISQTPEAGTKPDPNAGITVQVAKGEIIPEKLAAIWSSDQSRDGAEFARWIEGLTGQQVQSSGAVPASASLVVIGPGVPSGFQASRIPPTAAVLGIGAAGQKVLAQLDGQTFKSMGRFDSNGIGLETNDLEVLFRPQPSPFSNFRISAYPTILPVYQVDAGLIGVAGGRVPLVNPGNPRGGVAAWAGNRAFWGLANARALNEELRPVFLQIIQKITRGAEAPSAEGAGNTSPQPQ